MVHHLAKNHRPEFQRILAETSRLGPLQGETRIEPPGICRATLDAFTKTMGVDLGAIEQKLVAHLKRQPYIDPFADLPHFAAIVTSGNGNRPRRESNVFHTREQAEKWSADTLGKLPDEVRGAGKALIGFYRQGSHHVVDVDECPIGAMPHREILIAVKRWIATQRISVYDEASGRGLLRHLVLRSTLDGSRILAILVVSRRDSSLDSFREVLQPAGGEPLAHGVFLNFQPKSGNAIFGPETIRQSGTPTLMENLSGIKFSL